MTARTLPLVSIGITMPADLWIKVEAYADEHGIGFSRALCDLCAEALA